MAKLTVTPQSGHHRRVPAWTLPVCLLAFSLAGGEPAARANAVLNGTFTETPTWTGTGSAPTAGGALNTSDYSAGFTIPNWTVVDVNGSSGLGVFYFQGNQGSTTTANDGVNVNSRFGNFSVYDPGNVAGSTPSGGAIPNTSPGGGNFLAADGAVGYQLAIYQTLTGLTPGATYGVSFWYAAGQQYSFTGTTTEGWQVSLESSAQLTQVAANGTTIQDTPTQPGGGLAQGSFQAWAQDTLYFTASSSTQVLTFLSLGTPSGQPPVDFLSDVVIATPEPATLALSGTVIASLVGLLWFRRYRLSKKA